MQYYSLNNIAKNVGFKEAVIRGLAPDKGLYFPSSIEKLKPEFWMNIDSYDQNDIAYNLIAQFVGEDIPDSKLREILEETLVFPFPIHRLDQTISFLELYHGPTMAFKDVGARFMARCLGFFNKDQTQDVTVLVATSGDTGGAVANGFLGVEGVNVVILYPSGKVSEVQEKQLTTLGQNIRAIEVNGAFDDCQDMVKRAFLDNDLSEKMQLTSANSINVARWLPQMFYFALAYAEMKNTEEDLVFVVPSGNFGNICAGMMAQKLGMPIKHFVAANNLNNSVTEYLETAHYRPTKTVPTISNAMDVGNPSNFIRIQEIYENNFDELKGNLSSYSFNDEQTKKAIAHLYRDFNYLADPHGAVGYLGAKQHLKSNPRSHCICLETAHPAKFLDVVEEVTGKKVELPAQLASVMNKTKKSEKISSYSELKELLLS